MAARIRRGTKEIPMSEDWKNKIRAKQIINRLESHVIDDKEMSSSQVQAAKILLGKIVPDVNKVTHEGGDPDKPIQNKITVEFVDTPS